MTKGFAGMTLIVNQSSYTGLYPPDDKETQRGL
jgi:hypothetical protein